MHSAHRSAFDRPAVYRIRVEGSLQASWSDRLAGMAIRPEASGKGPPTTTLVGELRDQASLAGVLEALYELHCPLLLVERLLPEEHAAPQTTPDP